MREETIERMAKPGDFYRLRWRFILQGKPDRYGIWNGASPRAEDSAWAIDKTGLIAAVIEGECIRTHQLCQLFSMSGNEYAFCQYEAYSKVPGLGPSSGSWKLRTHISGLSLLSNDKKYTVGVDGGITSRHLSAEEKRFQFKEHTSGI